MSAGHNLTAELRGRGFIGETTDAQAVVGLTPDRNRLDFGLLAAEKCRLRARDAVPLTLQMCIRDRPGPAGQTA